MQQDTEIEDPAGDNKSPSSTNPVCQQGGSQSTEKGASGKNGDDESRLGRADSQRPIDIRVAGGKLVLPVVHGKDAADGAGVITEQKAAKGHKDADDDGEPDGSRFIGRTREERHDG